MALLIRTPAELVAYLKVRRTMAQAQNATHKNDPRTYGSMVYAFDEAIKAAEALAAFTAPPEERPV